MNETHQFIRVEFRRFKAFLKYTLHLRQFNILVGPNNAGKSTILAAFRILAVAMRKASSKKPEFIREHAIQGLGYDLAQARKHEDDIHVKRFRAV